MAVRSGSIDLFSLFTPVHRFRHRHRHVHRHARNAQRLPASLAACPVCPPALSRRRLCGWDSRVAHFGPMRAEQRLKLSSLPGPGLPWLGEWVRSVLCSAQALSLSGVALLSSSQTSFASGASPGLWCLCSYTTLLYPTATPQHGSSNSSSNPQPTPSPIRPP